MDSKEELARFSALERDMLGEAKISLISVGVDIGSSTSHLIFSRLVLERQGSRYVVIERDILYESSILLTPYVDLTTIDGEALGRFIEAQYGAAGLRREDVDTGALILTGVALLRDNARRIADLFAEEAGKFVAVSAGDNLEAIMAAHGAGAVAMSQDGARAVMNVDVGGGTTKIVVCVDGRARSIATLDVGARLVATDSDGRLTRLEEAGRSLARALGMELELGSPLNAGDKEKLAFAMAHRLFEHIKMGPLSGDAERLLRTPPLEAGLQIERYTFSGGVSEYIYGREPRQFGDIGAMLGAELRRLMDAEGLDLRAPLAGIRATVIGASQYSVQVSGSTIFVHPASAVPIRNVPVIRPAFDLDNDEAIEAAGIERAVLEDLRRFDLGESETPVAIALKWRGPATYDRLDGFCRGILAGSRALLAKGHPLILVYDSDVGGLLGIHLKSEMEIPNPVISIDGVELQEFDFIDVGGLIPSTGAVPVVIKSLVFPPAAST